MDTPLYVTASVLVAALFAVVALPLVINRSAPGLTGPLAGLVLAVWLVTTALLASNGAYQPAAYGAVPPLGIALVLALAGIALAVGAVPQLRAILSDPAAQRGLLGLQVWRIVGLARRLHHRCNRTIRGTQPSPSKPGDGLEPVWLG